MLGAKVGVDDRLMAERAAVVMNGGGVVGGVHEIVEIGNPRAGHGHQGNGDLTVVNGSRGQHAGDGDLAAGDIDMQLVADPGLLVALAVFLGADVAGGGQLGEHLVDGLRGLPLQPRRLGLWPLLVLARASALARRLSAIGRRIVLLVVGLVRRRLLARLDLGGVSGDHADDAPAQRALDQRCVHFVGQIAMRELREGARERGFRGHLRASLPTEDTPQRLVDGEAFDQSGRGGNAQHRLGDEGPGEGAPILGRAAGAAWWIRNESFEADHIECRDETPERLGQRIDLLAQPRKQGALDMTSNGLSWRRGDRRTCCSLRIGKYKNSITAYSYRVQRYIFCQQT